MTTSQNSQIPDVGALLQGASNDGVLSPMSMQALNIPNLGTQIQAALGTPADLVQASEAVLVTVMPDDSGSIQFAGNAQAVRDGHNTVIEALMDSKQQAGILFHTRYLNGEILNPFTPLDQAEQMDTHNYHPNKGTPLYDQAIQVLATVLAKTQEFADNGIPARSVTLIISDGNDQHSLNADAKTVATIVKDMLQTEQHIIAAMGIDDGSTDFHKVFTEMGILPEWILTPGNNQGEIRKAFQVFSQSAVRASQGALSCSQTALRGFGAP